MRRCKNTHLRTATISDSNRTSWWLRGKPLQGLQPHLTTPDSGTGSRKSSAGHSRRKVTKNHTYSLLSTEQGWGIQSKYCYYRCHPKTTYTFSKDQQAKSSLKSFLLKMEDSSSTTQEIKYIWEQWKPEDRPKNKTRNGSPPPPDTNLTHTSLS